MNARAAVSKFSNSLFPDQHELSEQEKENETKTSTKLGFFEEHEAITKLPDEIIDSDTDSDLVVEEESKEIDDEKFEIKNEQQQQRINQQNFDYDDDDEKEEDDSIFNEKRLEPLIEKKIEQFNKQPIEQTNFKKFDFMNDDEDPVVEETDVKFIEKIDHNIDARTKPQTIEKIEKIIAEPKVTTEFISTRTDYKPVITSNRKPLGAKKVKIHQFFSFFYDLTFFFFAF